MTTAQYYNPLANANFDDKVCFLSGETLSSSNTNSIFVFPVWIMDRFELRSRTFKMMDNYSTIRYEDMKLPCSNEVKVKFDSLDKEIKAAFDKGYEGVIALKSEQLFWWTARIVYGTLYIDLVAEKKKQDATNKNLELSATLKERLSFFHLMLQSIIKPLRFKEKQPWSISIVKLKYTKDLFNYHDDTINLLFSLGMRGFGIIVCLQDNGLIKSHYQDILNKIGEKTMHPIQFEELYSKFLYSNFLLKNKPKFKLESNGSGNIIETISDDEADFGKWDDNTFAAVLLEYWRPWGFEAKDILKFPEGTKSFLETEKTYDYIDPMSIELPF
ncbi:MAG: hypothetical protein J5I91_02830 [Bacteroidetes bacterium]|nr:hypothetical protein [Bacteroidota bacterium]